MFTRFIVASLLGLLSLTASAQHAALRQQLASLAQAALGTSATNAAGLSPATNDVGVIQLPNGQHLALAVLVRDSQVDLETREWIIACIAEAVYQAFK